MTDEERAKLATAAAAIGETIGANTRKAMAGIPADMLLATAKTQAEIGAALSAIITLVMRVQQLQVENVGLKAENDRLRTRVTEKMRRRRTR